MTIQSLNVLLRCSKRKHPCHPTCTPTPEAKAMDQDAGLHVLASGGSIFWRDILHTGWLCCDNQKRSKMNRTIPWKEIVYFSRATNRRCWEYSYADTISSAYHTSRLSRRNLSGDQAGIVFDKRFVSFDTACGISKVLDVIRLLITDPLGLRWTTYRWNLGMWLKECGCKHRCILAHQWMIFFCNHHMHDTARLCNCMNVVPWDLQSWCTWLLTVMDLTSQWASWYILMIISRVAINQAERYTSDMLLFQSGAVPKLAK